MNQIKKFKNIEELVSAGGVLLLCVGNSELYELGNDRYIYCKGELIYFNLNNRKLKEVKEDEK